MSTKHILVIEDEPEVRENIQEILCFQNFYVSVAENGRIGLELVAEHPPDLIICDILMPEVDGYNVLTALRQNVLTANIPIILVTAKAERSEVRYGMEIGADDYLIKPFSPKELLNAIASRLQKRELMEQQTQHKMEELRSSIIASLPHELRTPLTGIIGCSQLLLDEHRMLSSEETIEMVSAIYRSGKRLYHLTQNFLVYAELELLASNPEKVNLLRQASPKSFPNSIITQSAVAIATMVNRTDDLSLELGANVLLPISEIKLKKVLDEVLDNAFKFSTTGDSIRLLSHTDEDFFILYIQDQGRGMTPEQLSMVGACMQFERKLYEQQGTGLGLAIAKRIVELHGGQLTIESFHQKQTTVRIALPYVQR